MLRWQWSSLESNYPLFGVRDLAAPLSITSFTVSDAAVGKAPLIKFVGDRHDDIVLTTAANYAALKPALGENNGEYYMVDDDDDESTTRRTLESIVNAHPDNTKTLYVDGELDEGESGDCLSSKTPLQES